jgi:hypothetical protein
MEHLQALPSPPEEHVAELRRKLSEERRPESPTAWPPLLQNPRDKMDTRYASVPTSHRPLLGPPLVLAKRAFRLAFQPFINEVLRRQVEFNEAILESLALVYEQMRENARTQAAWRKDVEERLQRMEEGSKRS